MFHVFSVRTSQHLELSSGAGFLESQASQTRALGSGQHKYRKRFYFWPPRKCIGIVQEILALSATVETSVVVKKKRIDRGEVTIS